MRGILLAVTVFGAGLPSGAGAAELVLEGNVLEPSTTLEVRFAAEMVRGDQLGVPVEPAPVVVRPALPGRFTWLSRRSGVYVPTAAPKMGTTYVLELAPGLKNAAGAPVGETLHAELQTPAFSLRAASNADAQEVTPVPEISLLANRTVNLESARGHMGFVNDEGKKVAAAVSYADPGKYFPAGQDMGDWEARWAGKPGPTEETAEVQKHRLVVGPVEPLPVGEGWRLEIGAGVQALTGGLRTDAPVMVKLGVVKPFTITSLTTSSYLNSGRSVALIFSEPMNEAVNEETAGQYLKVTPAVPELRLEPGFGEVTMTGKFEQGREYQLEVDAKLKSGFEVPVSGELRRKFSFDAVAPRAYLPTITGHQIQGGRRKFPVVSVNLQKLRVVARVVPPAQVPQAVAAFEKYNREEASDNEAYQPLPPESITGKVLYDRTVTLPAAALDARQETVLDWTEILAGQGAGAIFLTVEGTPVAELAGPKPGAQALIQLTDLGVLWKSLGAKLEVSTFAMGTGRAVPGAKVTLLKEDFSVLSTAVADAAGQARLPMSTAPVWLQVRNGADQHTLPFGEQAQDLPTAAFHLPIFYPGWGAEEAPPAAARTFMFTDRPLYKPGETVHVRGYVRRTEAKGLQMVAAQPLVLTLEKPNQETSTVEVTTDAQGAFEAELGLGEGPLGLYFARVNVAEEASALTLTGGSTTFQVAEFQPNAFELTVQAPARYAPAEPVRAEVRGQYFFGAPLEAAQARWTLQFVEEPFTAEAFPEWQFGSPVEEGKPLTLRGEGTLPKGGALPVEPRLPEPTQQPQRGVLTVEVTDANQQTVSQAHAFRRDATDFYLGVRQTEQYVYGHDETIAFQTVAVQPTGEPLPEAVAVRAQLMRVRVETVRVQGAGGGVAFETKRTEELVATQEGRSLVPARAGTDWQVPVGETVHFQPGRAGEYLVRLEAKDVHGRTTGSTVEFTVSGSEPVVWEFRHPAQVDLVPDKAEYLPGETARVLVKAPFSGEAMVSLERGQQVLRTQRVTLTGNAPTVEVPIKAGDAPNLFVSFILIRGAEASTREFKVPEFRYGICQLRVKDPTAALQVKLTPKDVVVEPGQTIETEVAVLDDKGAGVAGAEVTFFAPDDGILALTGYERPQPGGIFQEPYPLQVRTGISLIDLLAEDPSALEFANKGYLIGGGGLNGPSPTLRQDFPGTAYWQPRLRTNAQGRVTVRFKAPDALTRYRLVAVAAAGAGRFGSGESAVAIRQKLMLLSGMGQTGRMGDTLLARAVVRNESGADGTAEVTLGLDNLAEAKGGGLTQKVALKTGEAQTVEFPIRLRKEGVAQWAWQARMEAGGRQYEDGLAQTLRIGTAVPLLRETHLFDLREKNTNLLTGVNPQILEGTGAVRVTLANTRLAGLREATQALFTYPYGCAEQQLSALAPWLTMNTLRGVLPELNRTPEEVTALVQHAVEKLFQQQAESGGLAYWPGGFQANYFVSAYGLLVCSRLREAGLEPPATMEKLLAYVATAPDGNTRLVATPDDLALGCWAAAVGGQPQAARHEVLFTRRAEMTLEGRAWLALAIMEAQGPTQMVATLLDGRAPAPEGDSWYGSATRERAARLLAWSRYKPKDKEVGRLFAEVLAARRNGVWRTTQENAWALLALAGAAGSERAGQPVVGTVRQQGVALPFSLTAKALTKTDRFGFDPGSPLGELSVQNPKVGNLFAEATFTAYPPVAVQPRQDRGYNVTRTYRKVAADGTLQEAKELRMGDRVLVSLRVETTAPGHFVAVDDPLPATLEALNPEFHTQGADPAMDVQPWAADYREMRADRVVYFCDHLRPGVYAFQYLARVRMAGKVTAPAVKVEEMYRPERFGMSASGELETAAR